MRQKGDSIKEANKDECEDIFFRQETRHGALYIVFDFSSHNFGNLTYQLRSEITKVIGSLDALAAPTPELYLGYVAKDINNYVYRMSRDVCNGKLHCVAAMCLFKGNRLTYLTYGDARVNIFDGENLLLLNGAKYHTLTVVSETQDSPKPIDENPEQFGRKFFELPLPERAHTLTLRDTDTVLIFSDGVEEVLPPHERLKELRRLAAAEPEQIYDAIMQATTAVQDDRTLVVIKGGYGELADPVRQDFDTKLGDLRAWVGTHTATELQQHGNALRTSITDEFNLIIRDISSEFASSVDELKRLISAKADAELLTRQESTLLGHQQRLSTLESASAGKKKGGDAKPAKAGQASEADGDEAALRSYLEQAVAADPAWWNQLVGRAVSVVNGRNQKPPAAGEGETQVVVAKPSEDGKQQGAEDDIKKQDKDKAESRFYNRDENRSLLGVLLGAGPDNLPGSLARAMLFVLLGFGLAWALSWFRGDTRTEQVWRVRATENVVRMSRGTPGSNEEIVEFKLAHPVSGGSNQEIELANLKQFADYLNSIGAVKRDANTSANTNQPTDDNSNVGTNLPVAQSIKVARGDTLDSITKRYGTTEQEIIRLNPNLKRDRNNRIVLQLNQELILPLQNANANTQRTTTPR
jgi:LysM repeat protein